MMILRFIGLWAQTMHNKGIYQEAIYFYKNFLARIDIDSKRGIQARIELKNCIFSQQNNNSKKQILVQGFGEEINTLANEVHVAQSPQFGNLFLLFLLIMSSAINARKLSK